MNKIADLKNSSNVEEIVIQLFELIKQKDKNISNELSNFDDNIIPKILGISKELASANFDNTILQDKKIQLESYYKDVSKFTQVFDLLGKRVDNEIKNNDSLSKIEKEDLQQDFLFTIKQKHMDLFAVKQQCETIFNAIEEKSNDKQTSEKPALLEKIKEIKNTFTENSNSNTANNKLK